MNALRTADVTARVVTWHNRHPLARRITRTQVSGVGIVALPFALKAPAGEAVAPAAPQDLTPIFGDDWMFHAAPQRLGAWVRAHGVYPLVGAAHWPLRQIDADLPLARRADAQGLEGRTVRHLVTAVIDVAGQRVRVLLTPHEAMKTAAVFGSRVYSVPRGSALAGASAALGLALGLLPGLRADAPSVDGGIVLAAGSGASAALSSRMGSAESPASAASASSKAPWTHPYLSASAGSVAATMHAASGALPVAASGAAPGAPSGASSGADSDRGHLAATKPPATSAAQHGAAPLHSPPASPLRPTRPPAALQAASAPPVAQARAPAEIQEPADVAPEVRDRATGAAPLVRIRPELTEEERREARLRSASLRPAASAPAAAAVKRPVFAIVTPGLRTRVDAEAQKVLLQGLMAQTASTVPTHLDVMAAKGRWRVVWWPHPQQKQAEQLLLEARARGLKVELITF